jgi:hypothetical protein
MNQVPWLRSGVGTTPADGGCIMQVIDWINREEWTDRPPCVHPVIRALAININDSADDQQRQKLLDLAPRMMNTASDDKQLSVKLAIFCAERVLHIFEEKYPNDDRPRKAIEAAKNGGDRNAADAAAYVAADAADAKLDLLVAVLDEYDRLVPRVAIEEIDWTPAVCVMGA